MTAERYSAIRRPPRSSKHAVALPHFHRLLNAHGISLSDGPSFVLDCIGAARLPIITFPQRPRMDEKQLAKLVRQNAAKAAKVAKARKGRAYDPTLPPTDDEEDVAIERQRFFKEMKRREF